MVVGSVPPISLKASSYEVLIGKTVTVHAGMWDWAGHTTDGGQYDCFSCDSSALEWTTRGDAFAVDSNHANVDADVRRGYEMLILNFNFFLFFVAKIAKVIYNNTRQCGTSNFMAAHPGSSVIHVNYGDSYHFNFLFIAELFILYEAKF